MILTNTEILLLDSLTQISLPSCSARPGALTHPAVVGWGGFRRKGRRGY
jgi:hypothetical protein